VTVGTMSVVLSFSFLRASSQATGLWIVGEHGEAGRDTDVAVIDSGLRVPALGFRASASHRT
jgi:hypothetical protein